MFFGKKSKFCSSFSKKIRIFAPSEIKYGMKNQKGNTISHMFLQVGSSASIISVRCMVGAFVFRQVWRCLRIANGDQPYSLLL